MRVIGRGALLLVLLAATASAQSESTSATRVKPVSSGSAPRSLDELKDIQNRIRTVTDRILAATVAIQVGRANGSGVIIDQEGHVLTAAHVAGQPGLRATIHLTNGRTVYGTTLGLNQELDSGLILITDRGPWPYAPPGDSSKVQDGQWCLATGHPGGYDASRPPVLRWGRVLRTESSAILTDCTLVGGDSGGPLFDLNGNVIGIHSRIGKNLTVNVHVPIDPFIQSWDRLVQGEVWGLLAEQEASSAAAESSGEGPASDFAWLGVIEDRRSTDRVRISDVVPDSPAARAGLESGDVVEQIDQTTIDSFGTLQREIRDRAPGDRVRLQVRRGDVVLKLHVRLGGRVQIPRP